MRETLDQWGHEQWLPDRVLKYDLAAEASPARLAAAQDIVLLLRYLQVRKFEFLHFPRWEVRQPKKSASSLLASAFSVSQCAVSGTGIAGAGQANSAVLTPYSRLGLQGFNVGGF